MPSHSERDRIYNWVRNSSTLAFICARHFLLQHLNILTWIMRSGKVIPLTSQWLNITNPVRSHSHPTAEIQGKMDRNFPTDCRSWSYCLKWLRNGLVVFNHWDLSGMTFPLRTIQVKMFKCWGKKCRPQMKPRVAPHKPAYFTITSAVSLANA